MEITYTWNLARFLEAARANYDYKFKSLKFRLIGYFGIVFIFVGAYFAITKGVYATLITAFVLTVYWFVLRWPFYRWQLSLQFNKHAARDKTVTWHIEADSFSISSEGGGGHYDWDAITDIQESDEGFLVRQYPVYYWIPKDCFESAEDLSWFRDRVLSRFREKKQTT